MEEQGFRITATQAQDLCPLKPSGPQGFRITATQVQDLCPLNPSRPFSCCRPSSPPHWFLGRLLSALTERYPHPINSGWESGMSHGQTDLTEVIISAPETPQPLCCE